MIKYLVMDVDGTLTDGKIYMGENGELMKAFSIKDGYGIAHLRDNGIEPVILTGRKSEIVARRAKELGILLIFQGVEDKESFLQAFMNERKVQKEEMAYIGDDDNDIQGMSLCKWIGCPSDASPNVITMSSFVSSCVGGNGAVREFIEYVQKINKEN